MKIKTTSVIITCLLLILAAISATVLYQNEADLIDECMRDGHKRYECIDMISPKRVIVEQY